MVTIDLIAQLWNHKSKKYTKEQLKYPVYSIQTHLTFNTAVGTCVSRKSISSIHYFPVCGLFTLFFGVPTETIVCSFGVKAQDLPLFMDSEREGGHWCSYEESEKKCTNKRGQWCRRFTPWKVTWAWDTHVRAATPWLVFQVSFLLQCC